MLQALDAAAARRWAELAVTALDGDREAIDRINVYPVPDGDTGTNLLQTMRTALAALDSAGTADTAGEVLTALAKGALNGARGNSGMLLSQFLRGLAEELRAAPAVDGAALCGGLARSAALAGHAVAEPVAGTFLSVLDAASAAAAASGSGTLGGVVRAAVTASVRALAETTRQLPVLAAAGVVDAGGRGLVVLLDALHAVVHEGTRIAPEPPSAAGRAVAVEQPAAASHYAYEVMYLLADTDAGRAGRLRETLRGLGDCVSVVGDGSDVWAVHVHCDDIGAAIESGIGAGRVHRIAVTRFADQPGATCPSGDGQAAGRRSAERAVVAAVRGGGLAELFRAEGARVLPVDPARLPDVDTLLAGITATGAGHVVVLPNDERVTAAAERAAGRAVREGQDVVVVPTSSPVQGLAALAVHDPSRRPADDAVAMAEAAAATRRGELVVATSEALTWAGRCRPGDVLGMADGEVVLIGEDLGPAACELVDRMLTAGGELVTVLLDRAAPERLGAELAEHLGGTHPEVELTCYPGGDLGAALMLGVE